MDIDLYDLFFESDIGRIIYGLVAEYCIMNDNATYYSAILYYTNDGVFELYDDDDIYEAINDDIFLALDFVEQAYFKYYGTHLYLYEVSNPNDLINMIFFFVFNEYKKDHELN